MKTARKPKPLESVVQKECLAVLKRLGVKAWRRNIAAMSGEYNGKKRFIKSGEPGQSDIWGYLPLFYLSGCMHFENQRPQVHYEVEIKRLGGKPTLDQITWLRETNDTTGASFWVDSAGVLETVVLSIMCGGRIVYHDGTCSYPNPVKGCKGRVDGPSWDFDVEEG